MPAPSRAVARIARVAIGVVLATCLDAAPPLAAQAEAPRYAPLACAQLRERTIALATTFHEGRREETRTERDGVWRLMLTARADSLLDVEAWYDSLALVQRAGGASTAVDTDPVIGGRFEGVLASDGRFGITTRPFVPDDIAQVAALGRAADELLPRLPAEGLAVGTALPLDDARTITRLADSLVLGRPLWRYRLEERTEGGALAVRGDTTTVRGTQDAIATTQIVWHPVRGLLRAERSEVVTSRLDAGGRVRRPVEARVETRRRIERIADAPGCRATGR